MTVVVHYQTVICSFNVGIRPDTIQASASSEQPQQLIPHIFAEGHLIYDIRYDGWFFGNQWSPRGIIHLSLTGWLFFWLKFVIFLTVVSAVVFQ